MTAKKEHWEKIYSERKPDEVSWFQTNPAKSLEFIRQSGLPKNGAFIDVGGGASVLVDKLLAQGFMNLSVLDLSGAALTYAKERLGNAASQVHWFESDVLDFHAPQTYDFWHDRAVFHFPTDAQDRKRYAELLLKSVHKGGHILLAPFAMNGPEKCSGLEVCRYDADSICKELGSGLKLLSQDTETHVTPWEKEQKFAYFQFQRI